MGYTKKLNELSGIDQNELWEKISKRHSAAYNVNKSFIEMAERASEKLERLKEKR